MKIFIGADHNGYGLKQSIIDYLHKAGYDVVDVGDTELQPEDDFPVFAHKLVKDLLVEGAGNAKGILLCGSGQGMCMAANRYKGVRALLGYDRESVRASRNDDDANVLCMPAHTLQADQANVLVETFLNTPYANAARFNRRIKEMDEV